MIGASYPMTDVGTRCVEYSLPFCANVNISINVCEPRLLCGCTTMKAITQPIFVHLLIMKDDNRREHVPILHSCTIFTYPCRLETTDSLLNTAVLFYAL